MAFSHAKSELQLQPKEHDDVRLARQKGLMQSKEARWDAAIA
jgi:hypothetical protein